MKNIAQIWEKCLDLLIKNELIQQAIFDTFLINTKLDSLSDSNANVIVEDEFAKQILVGYIDKIEKVLLEVTETNFKIKFYLENELLNNNEDHQLSILNEDNLNDNYIFENYVIGPSNRDSYRAAVAISDQPGKMFNPLFIYGNTGVGKSHLAHAIGNEIKHNFPNMRILYVTSHQFEEDFTSIYKEKGREDKNKESAFSQKYNHLDVLIIDDIQMLGVGEKTKTKNYFFNIYNELYSKNKQIIIISDVKPEDLNGLEERLISRFNSGLKTIILPPEYETSLEILKKKIDSYDDNGFNISEEALKYVAKNFSKDVRSLEGTLNTILLYSTNNHLENEIDLTIVKDIFKDDIKEICDGNITQKSIMDVVCKYYNISRTQITSKSRQQLISTARHIAIYLTRNLLELPYEKIGDIYGKRDHSTIMSSYNKIKVKLDKKEENYVVVVNEIKRLLKNK